MGKGFSIQKLICGCSLTIILHGVRFRTTVTTVTQRGAEPDSMLANTAESLYHLRECFKNGLNLYLNNS